MNRFEKIITSLMKTLVHQCEHENHFRANNMTERTHECISTIAILENILAQVHFYITFDTDDKLNYTKVHFKDMITRIEIVYDILSTKERLNAMKGELCRYYNGGEDGYEL